MKHQPSGNNNSFTYTDNKGQILYQANYDENGFLIKEQSYIDLDKVFEQGKLFFDSSQDCWNSREEVQLLYKATQEFNKIIAVFEKKPDYIWHNGGGDDFNPYSKFPKQTFKCSFSYAAVLYYIGAIEVILAEHSTNWDIREAAYRYFARAIEFDKTFSPTYLALWYAYYDREQYEVEKYWAINELFELYIKHRKKSEDKYLHSNWSGDFFDFMLEQIKEAGTYTRICIENCYKKLDEFIIKPPQIECKNLIEETKLELDDLIEHLDEGSYSNLWFKAKSQPFVFNKYFYAYQIYHLYFTIEALIIKSYGVTIEINNDVLFINCQNKDLDQNDTNILNTSLDNLINNFKELTYYYKNANKADERIKNDQLYNLLLSIESDNIRYHIKN